MKYLKKICNECGVGEMYIIDRFVVNEYDHEENYEYDIEIEEYVCEFCGYSEQVWHG